MSEAKVVCRQLGFTSAAVSFSSIQGSPNQPATVGGSVKCSGNEENLAFCVVSLTTKSSCDGPSAVQCTGMSTPLRQNGSNSLHKDHLYVGCKK